MKKTPQLATKKLQIAHVITGLPIGGAERSFFNLLNNGIADTFDNIVISLQDDGSYGESIRKLGIPVHLLEMRRSTLDPTAIIRLYRLVRDLNPDIVQGWMYHGNLAAYLVKQMCRGKPMLALNIRQSLYGLTGEKPLTRQIIRANRWLSYRAEAIIYNSQMSLDLHSAFGFSRKNSRVVFNGFNTKKFKPDHNCGLHVRRALGIPEMARVVGHVARFHPMKDHAIFLRTIVRALENQHDIYILLIGTDITASNHYLSNIIPDRLKYRFHFLGERSDIPELMQAMDIFVQSSWSEAFPNVLGEAMSTGVPCLATNVGDSKLIIGNTGIIVPPKNDEALLAGLTEILKKTHEERQCLGRAARTRIIENYSLGTTVSQYVDLYSALKCSGGIAKCAE